MVAFSPGRAGNGTLKDMTPTLVEQFKKVAEVHEKKLAQSASQAWLLRRRVPTTRIASLFRAGLPLGIVVAQTALVVLEMWVHELKGIASKAEIVEFIQGLVHSDDPAKLPPGPLREALRKAVPKGKDAGRAENQWDFLDELLTAMDLEDRFEMSSPVHSMPSHQQRKRPAYHGAPLPARKAVPGLGVHPTAKRGASLATSIMSHNSSTGSRKTADMGRRTSNFSFGTLDESSGFRDTGATNSTMGGLFKKSTSSPILGRKDFNMSAQKGSFPGPGHYSETSLSSAILTPKRGEFPSVGRARALCMVNSLSQRSRFPEDTF